MAQMKEYLQEADWKKEKHVPAIDAPDAVKKGEFFKVTVAVGKEIAHPNTTAHHITWIASYFIPDGEKFPYLISRSELSSHGASAQGADTSTVYTASEAAFSMKSEKSGTILVISCCNIHGLWESSKKIEVK